ncbi:MAG TPA: portal protein [Nitrospiraceae bacterium]
MAKDSDLVKDALECFSLFSDQENEQRDLMLKDYEFRALKQWPDDIRMRRENDPHGARPCLTFDRTNQHVRQVVNDARINRAGMKVRPVDDVADPKTAEMINGTLRHIESKSTSKADIAYDWAIECAATGGLGWFRLGVEVIDARGNQEPCVWRIANPMSVYVGTAWAEPDGCDIEEAFITMEMPRKEFVRRYKDAVPLSVADAKGDQVEWVGPETIRIAEWFRIETTKTNMLMLRGQSSAMSEGDYWKAYKGKADRPEVSGNYDKRNSKVVHRKITAKDILEETEFPASYIPLIPVIGNEVWVGNKRILFGMVRPARDPQMMYNLERSNYAEHVTMAPRAKWLMADGQNEGFESQWQRANVSSDPVLMYHPQVDGQPVSPPQRVFGPEAPQGLLVGMQASERDLQAAMGQYGPTLGAPSQERSGIAIREKKTEGDRGNFHYADNLSRSIRHACSVVVGSSEMPGMLQRLYDVPRIARILGQDGKPSFAQIDPEQQAAYREYQQEDGSIRKVFNPAVGTYDVIPASGPAYPTLRAEAAAAMVQIVQAQPQILQTHGDLIFESQDWPDAERFAKRFKAMLPPQLQDASGPESEGPLDPEAVQAVMQREQQIQLMTAQMQQMQQALQAMAQKAQSNDADSMKAQADVMQLQIKQDELRIKEYQAITDRMVAQADIDLKREQADKINAETAHQDAGLLDRVRQATAMKNADGTWTLNMGEMH